MFKERKLFAVTTKRAGLAGAQLSKYTVKKGSILRLHYLDKSEHLVRSLIGIMFIVIRHRMVGFEIFAPKLIDLETALVYVKMNIALFKIGSTGLPNLRFGVQSLNRLPRAIADALGVLLGGNE